jgi:sugar phosphate permease
MRCRRFWRIELDVYIDLLQWPAMVVTVIAAWLIGSLQPGRRFVGFCCFLLSNLLWVIWGWHAEAWALITLQVCLALMNLRGVKKNDAPTQPEPDAPRA